MDPRRFDDAVRRLTLQQNRRNVLRFSLSALASAAYTRSGGAARAQEACSEGCPPDQTCIAGGCYTPCENHRDCRSKKKDDPCIDNSCVDGFCVQAIIDCAPGFVCCDEGCCPQGCVSDADCGVVDPCVMSRCGSEGICEFTDVNPCVTCASDVDCAGQEQNTVCCEGACQRPCPDGTIMGKGCECGANESGVGEGVVVRDDASGTTPQNAKQRRRRR